MSRNRFPSHKQFSHDRRKVLGARAESQVCGFLRRAGYRVLERNYRCRFGEADIIALEDEVLVIVEVKSLSSPELDLALEKVDRRKQARLIRVAQYYAKHKGETGRNIRFDVAAVDMTGHGSAPPRIHLIKDAFRVW